ncbi:conserved Plasmodium protein, unknown function [Plasmodium gallinaceum]|uniref:Uncharacterized protein n=1 Tax=Plasmodium gallinaceum TaxID=5849 RepID=A0A1J1GSP4_PLAGA|nr:conserved Plasmodium protein, unknown function [Plasmodium gallinaceum]CRG94328.1 conserved Plasmodium protein, unknown function [Plasmodium gallinaceum]
MNKDIYEKENRKINEEKNINIIKTSTEKDEQYISEKEREMKNLDVDNEENIDSDNENSEGKSLNKKETKKKIDTNDNKKSKDLNNKIFSENICIRKTYNDVKENVFFKKDLKNPLEDKKIKNLEHAFIEEKSHLKKSEHCKKNYTNGNIKEKDKININKNSKGKENEDINKEINKIKFIKNKKNSEYNNNCENFVKSINSVKKKEIQLNNESSSEEENFFAIENLNEKNEGFFVNNSGIEDLCDMSIFENENLNCSIFSRFPDDIDKESKFMQDKELLETIDNEGKDDLERKNIINDEKELSCNNKSDYTCKEQNSLNKKKSIFIFNNIKNLYNSFIMNKSIDSDNSFLNTRMSSVNKKKEFLLNILSNSNETKTNLNKDYEKVKDLEKNKEEIKQNEKIIQRILNLTNSNNNKYNSKNNFIYDNEEEEKKKEKNCHINEVINDSYINKRKYSGIKGYEEMKKYNNFFFGNKIEKDNSVNMNYIYDKYKILLSEIKSGDYLNSIEKKLNIIENSLLCTSDLQDNKDEKLDIKKKFAEIFDNALDCLIDNYEEIKKKDDTEKLKKEQLNLTCDFNLFLRLCKMILNDEQIIHENNQKNILFYNNIYKTNYLLNCNKNKDIFYNIYARKFDLLLLRKKQKSRTKINYIKKGIIEKINILWFYEKYNDINYLHLYNLNNINSKVMTLIIDAPLECIDIVYLNKFFPLDTFYNSIKNYYLMIITENSFYFFNIHLYFNCEEDFNISVNEQLIYQTIYPFYFNLYLFLLFKLPKDIKKKIEFICSDEKNERIFLAQDNGIIYEFIYEKKELFKPLNIFKKIIINSLDALVSSVNEALFSQKKSVVDISKNENNIETKNKNILIHQYKKEEKTNFLSDREILDEYNKNIYCDDLQLVPIKYHLKKVFNTYSLKYFSFYRNKVRKILIDHDRSILYVLYENSDIYVKLLSSIIDNKKNYISETIIFTKNDLIKELKNIHFIDDNNLVYHDCFNTNNDFFYSNNNRKYLSPCIINKNSFNKLNIIDIHINCVHERNNIFLKLIDNNFNIYYLSLVKNLDNNNYKFVLRDFQNFPHKKGLKIDGKDSQAVFTLYLKNFYVIIKKKDIKKYKSIDSNKLSNINKNLLSQEDIDIIKKTKKFVSIKDNNAKIMRRNTNDMENIDNNEVKKNKKKMEDEENINDYDESDENDYENDEDNDDDENDEDDYDENDGKDEDNQLNKKKKENKFFYKVQLLTNSDEFVNTNISNYNKNKYVFKHLNEYYINEEIIGIIYKKKNYYFHEFFEKSQKDHIIKDFYVDKIKYDNRNNMINKNEDNMMNLTYENNLNHMNTTKKEENINFYGYNRNISNIYNKRNLINNDIGVHKNFIYKDSERNINKQKGKIESMPPFYLDENTISEYQQYYDLVIITKKHIYYITKNTKIQRIEKMINNYLNYNVTFENRNIKNIVLSELKIKEHLKNNTDEFYKNIKQNILNKNERANMPVKMNYEKKNHIIKKQNSFNLMREKNDYELIYEYFINQIIHISSNDEFLFIIWCLLLNHVYKFEIMCFNSIHNNNQKFIKNKPEESSNLSPKLNKLMQKSKENTSFYFNQKENDKKTQLEKIYIQKLQRKEDQYMKIKESTNQIDYDILNKIYKPTPFKFGFIDKSADYIIKQGKLQKAMELEIKTRKIKGINHLFNDSIDDIENEIIKNNNNKNKNDNLQDKFSENILLNDMESCNLFNIYEKKSTKEKFLDSEKNKSGNFAFEYLTNKNFDIIFLKNVNFYNSSLNLLSRGLLLLLSRLLKPVMFIHLFSCEKYQNNNIFKCSNNYLEKSRKFMKISECSKDLGISVISKDKNEEGEETFYNMKDYCIVRMNDDIQLKKKRKRSFYEDNELIILNGNVPLDCCLNLIEKLKCLSLCVSIVLTNLLKKKNDYANKIKEMTDISIINIYYDYTLIMVNEINEFYSILNFINFSIEYLLIYSIIISDYYKNKNIIKKNDINNKQNFLYLSSTLFDLLTKCNFMKTYFSKTYRDILKQCLFSIIKSEKYIPIEFFQGYIIHKNEFLALFLTKKIEEEIFLKKKMKIKENYEYYKNDKYDEFLASERRAEHFINENLKDALISINIFKLIILLYKADYYKCASTLISLYIDSFYKSLNFKDKNSEHFIEKKNLKSIYDNFFNLKEYYSSKILINNIDVEYDYDYFVLYSSCFLPVEKIVHVNYMKYLYKNNEKKKKKIKKFLITLLEYSSDINFHFFIFNLVLYKCKNEFPCSIFELNISQYLYYFIKLNELNIRDAFVYYFRELKYQDIVIFFARKAFCQWNISIEDNLLSTIYKNEVKKLKENENVKEEEEEEEEKEKDEEKKSGGIKKKKEEQNENIIIDNNNNNNNESSCDIFSSINNHISEYFLDFKSINKKSFINELTNNNYIYENNYIGNSYLLSNPLYNNETKNIFYNIYKYLFKIISFPSLKKRMEYIDNCMKTKIFIIQKVCNFKNKNYQKNKLLNEYIDSYNDETNNYFVHKKKGNLNELNESLKKKTIHELLNINCALDKEVLKNYYIVDKTNTYDEKFHKSIKTLFNKNKCLFKLKEEYLSNQNAYYLNLKEIKKCKTSLNYHKLLFHEIINLFVFYVYKFCQWDILKDYFDILMTGSKEEIKKVLEHFENINSEEIEVIRKSFSNMYDYLSKSKYEHIGDVITDYNHQINNVNNKINIKRIIDIIDTFKEFLIIIQKNIHTKEDLKNKIFSRSKFLFKNFLPSFNLLKLIILCDKKKDKIDKLNSNCFSTVNHMLKNDIKCSSFYFSKYSFCFERLLDFSFSLTISFENINFIINYIGDILKLYDIKFKNCLYLLVVIKMHKFMNNLFEIKKVRSLLKNKIGVLKTKKNEKMKLIYLLNCIPLIYLDSQMNVILINESYEYKTNQDKIIFSKLSPFSLITKVVNQKLRSVYSYHDYIDNYEEREEEEEEEKEKENETEYEDDKENDEKELRKKEEELKKKIKNDNIAIDRNDRKSLYYLYNINYCFNENENNENITNNRELIVLSYKNYCFYIVWISNLLLNHKVEYKSLINVYVKIHNNLKHQKSSHLEEHEIAIIIYYLFTMWINGDKNNCSFFFYNEEKSYNEKNYIGRFLKDKNGRSEYISNYSLITLLKELLSRAEFYFEYTSDAASRNYDISSIMLDSSIYDNEKIKKSSVDILKKFFDDIYITFNEVLTKIPFLNNIIEFQDIHDFLKKFKRYLEEIFCKITINENSFNC